MFMDFLKSLSLFGEKAPAERMKELIEIIEGQADLGSPFNVITQFLSFVFVLYAKRVCSILVKDSHDFRLLFWQIKGKAVQINFEGIMLFTYFLFNG